MPMRILDTMRQQKAVYWEPSGTDDYGNPKYSDPIELKVRWEDTAAEYLDKGGETAVSRSKIMMKDEHLKLDGILWKGKLADLIDDVNPYANPGASEINQLSEIPTLKADEMFVVAWL